MKPPVPKCTKKHRKNSNLPIPVNRAARAETGANTTMTFSMTSAALRNRPLTAGRNPVLPLPLRTPLPATHTQHPMWVTNPLLCSVNHESFPQYSKKTPKPERSKPTKDSSGEFTWSDFCAIFVSYLFSLYSRFALLMFNWFNWLCTLLH